MLVDSHEHLFLEQFSDDLPAVIERAKQVGVTHIFMPNIDSTTIKPLLDTCAQFSDICYPMIGLHPTSVNDDFKQELIIIEELLSVSNEFVAIGEIGIDLYWDKTFLQQQIVAFERQIELALEYNLPIVIHLRDSFDEIYNILIKYKDTSLSGIFHSFTGNGNEAKKLMEFPNFMLGINGVVTFKNSNLSDALIDIPLNRIVTETDAPYLAPVPFRGKRNESAYVKDIVLKLADVYHQDYESVSTTTSQNALKVFGMLK